MRKYTQHLKFTARDEADQKLLDEALALRKKNRNDKKVTSDVLIADLLRVANHPDNPFYGTCSKERYRRYGFFSELYVTRTFGTHQQFQRAAGLADARTDSAYRGRRARLHTEEKINAYFKSEILPFVGKFGTRKSRRDHRIVVVGSDFHGEYVDPFTLDVFVDVIKRTDPDVVCLNGDVVDFPSVSRWSKDPRKILNLQQEIDYTRKHILARVRQAAPESTIDWIIGNHEYRLVRFIADTAPELATLRSLRFSHLFDLEPLRINLVFGGNFLAPDASSQATEVTKNWKVYFDSYVCTHGDHTGKFPASKEVESYGMSGCSGHVHRPQMHSMPTLLNQYADWLSAGMMASHKAGESYVRGPTKWTNGFVVATIFPKKKLALQEPVLIKKGQAVFAGKIYTQKGAEQ